MGAETISRLIDRIDLDAEEIKLREMIDAADGRPAALGPAPPEGHQAPQDRHRLQPSRRARRRINDPRAMILEAVPVIPPTCARWSSSTVAASPPRT